MKNKLFVWVAVALLFASCKPSNEPEEPAVKNEVTVTVYNTNFQQRKRRRIFYFDCGRRFV